MVEVKAFNGVYYGKDKVGELACVVSPPHDVISPEDQASYYESSPYNIVRLILGKNSPDDTEEENQYTRAAKLLEEWLSEGVLTRDSEPAIYAYEQEFSLDNGSVKKQLGFIGLVKLEPFEKKIILPHERIISKMKEDRLQLMKKCRANLSLIITAYSDAKLTSNRMLEEKTKDDADIEVSFGKNPCIHRVWAIHDKDFIEEFTSLFNDKKFYIADGHHRYTTALEYHLNHDKTDASAHMLMYALNMEDNGVTILPAHRVLKNIEGFNVEEMKEKLSRYFDVKEYEIGDEDEFFAELESHKNENYFGMYCGNGSLYLLCLKDVAVMDGLGEDIPDVWKSMDVIILDRLILARVLGVESGEYAEREDLVFKKERKKAVTYVDERGFQVAFFLNSTSMHEVKDAAEKGERMPQKSTYFYPKPLSGLIMHKFE